MFRRRHYELTVNTKPDSSTVVAIDNACPTVGSECPPVNSNPHFHQASTEKPKDTVSGSLVCNLQGNNDECHREEMTVQRLTQVQAIICQSPNDPGSRTGRPHHAWKSAFRTPWSLCEQVWNQSFAMPPEELPGELCLSLQSPAFNNWPHSDAQLLICLRHMFVDLQLPQQCRFSLEVLENWLFAVYCRYNQLPFHNFKHAFCVTQMMYCCIALACLHDCLSAHDIFILMFSAISHDLDHPGFTNSYQINVQSWLALRYNDQSPLENHHCAVAFDLISNSLTNLAANFTPTEYSWFRKGVIRCILSTDMTLHGDCVSQFRELLPQYTDWEGGQSTPFSRGSAMDHLRRVFLERPEQRLVFMLTLVKICDISNEIRPLAVAKPWLDCLLDEFFHQAQLEKLAGLPVLSHMDPEKVAPAENQMNFIANLLLPLLTDVVKVLPQLETLKLSVVERLTEYNRDSSEKMEGTQDCTKNNSTVALSFSLSSHQLPENSFRASQSPSSPCPSLITDVSQPGSSDQDAELLDHPLLVPAKCSRLTNTEVVQSRSWTPPPLRVVLPESQQQQPIGTTIGYSPNLPGELATTTRFRRQSSTHQPPSPASLMFLKFTRLDNLEDNNRIPDEVVPVTEVTSPVSRKSSTGSMVSAIT